ncbi:MAG: SRPBCC domain-containing protein [Parasphingorhabdus sp.]
MTSQNYKRTISVKADPQKAFWALTEGMHEWWTTPDRPMLKLGDRSKFTFPPGKGYWTFEATVLEAKKRVEMVCVDALHLHEGMPKEIETEWLDTRVRWNIVWNGKTTDITVEHYGLVPTLHCYEICEAGWNLFFVGSLQAFLDTGTGKPHRVSD